MCEHIGISHLTGKRSKTRKISAVSDHELEAGHIPDLDSFCVLSKERSRSESKLLIRESLFIYKDQPSLNKTIQSYPLQLFNNE